MEKSQKRLVVLLVLIKTRYRTCYDAASALGIPNYRLSLILNGRAKLTDDLIVKIEELLQCSREVFLPPTENILETLFKSSGDATAGDKISDCDVDV